MDELGAGRLLPGRGNGVWTRLVVVGWKKSILKRNLVCIYLVKAVLKEGKI